MPRTCLKTVRRTFLSLQAPLLCLCLAWSLLCPLLEAAEPIRIGVAAEYSVAASEARWRPLASALNDAIADERFVIEAFAPDKLEDAILSRQLDFVLTEPGLQILMAHRIGLSAPLATLIDEQSSAYGGVIFTRQDSPLANLQDLQDQRIAVMASNSFAGYQAQAYEFSLANLNLKTFAIIDTVGWPESRVIDEVLHKRADAGFLRTGALEELIAQGQLQASDIRILNKQRLPGYAYAASTHLYPQLAFSALPHVDDNVSRKVAAALFNLNESNPAALKDMRINGFSVPASYIGVENVLSALRAPPYDLTPSFTARDVVNRYLWQIIVAVAAALLFLLLGAALIRNNRQLTTERGQAQAQRSLLADSESKLQSILDSSAVAIFWMNGADEIEYINNTFNQLFGYALTDVPTLQHWLDAAVPDDLYRRTALRDWIYLSKQKNLSAPPQQEFAIHCRNGQSKHVLASSSRAESRLIITLSDITERKQAEQLVQIQANFDPLTKLPNRRLFQDRLDQAIKHSIRNKSPMALMLIDLDHFKEINDTLGHKQGDALLIEAARRISACVRQNDTVARLGGDEFTIILTDLNATSGIEVVADKVVNALAQAFQLNDEQGFISASIGIALYPNDTDNAEDLIKHADQAMYHAKALGRNGYHFFTKSLQDAAQLRMELSRDLRHALSRNEFVIYYQPIVSLADFSPCKAEALIRWQHPEKGLISPDVFIPIAEENGLIIEIGDWVLQQTARQVMHWRTQAHAPRQISINRSPVQFSPAAIALGSWQASLQALQLPPGSLCIEITEGLLLDAQEHVKDELDAFRAMGIQAALDDFGTGYSSFAYLQKFDIDFLKIDRAFINNMEDSADDKLLCEAIIMMAHKLGLKVIAEGVETREQCDFLRAAHCDYAQGYYFAKPLPLAQFEAYLPHAQPISLQ